MTKKPPTKEQLEKYKETINLKYKNDPEFRKKKLEKGKIYREKNKEKILARKKENYLINREADNLRSKKYRLENKEKVKEYNKQYAINNKEKRQNRHKNRCLNDKLYELTTKIRTIIAKIFNRKKPKTIDIIGCSFEELKTHLESKFEPWMNWDNRGLYNGELNYGWDIDHIIPLSTAKTEEELVRLNHYTNLQPLCGYVNRVIKKDKTIDV